jgi:hypothetical protein
MDFFLKLIQSLVYDTSLADALVKFKKTTGGMVTNLYGSALNYQSTPSSS